MSRPKASETSLDIGEMEKLTSIGATQTEMSKWFGVSLSTIEKRLRRKKYRAALENGEARFAITIRRKQAQLADEGNATMLIWLGKQVLGQRDKFDQQHSGTGPQGSILVPLDSARERLKAAWDSLAARLQEARLREGSG